jgi:hypothetical protein
MTDHSTNAAQAGQEPSEPGPSLETRVRAQMRIPLIKIAAECHRQKWRFSFDEEEKRLPAAEARGLVRAAFNVIHNIGDTAHKAAEALKSEEKMTSRSSAGTEVLRKALEAIIAEISPNQGGTLGAIRKCASAAINEVCK